MTNRASTVRPRWSRHGRVGSLVWSADFGLSLLFAICAGLLVAVFDAAVLQVPATLITFAAVDAGLLAAVLGASVAVVSLISPEYLTIINRTPNGVAGIARTFNRTATIAGAGCVLSLAAVFVFPTVPLRPGITFDVMRAVILGLALCPASWAIPATVQLVHQVSFHLTQRGQLAQALGEARRRLRERRD